MKTESRTCASEPLTLTLRHRVFADNYLLHGNASEAARGAGYALKNAPKQGSELLARADVQAYLTARRDELAAEFGLSREAVTREIRAVAHSSLDHYDLSNDGKLLTSAGAPPDAIRAVRSFKNRQRRAEKTFADGSRSVVTTVETEISLWPKIEALRMAAEILALVGRNAPSLAERVEAAVEVLPTIAGGDTRKTQVLVRVVRE